MSTRIVAIAVAYLVFLVPHFLITSWGTNWAVVLWQKPWLLAVYTLPALAVADRIYRRIVRTSPNDSRSAARAQKDDEPEEKK
jgi:hypothetical protein